MAEHRHILTIRELSATRATAFSVQLDEAARRNLMATLDLQSLRKLRFEGRITPHGRKLWRLDATLGATVVQTCVVTLAPASTRVDATVTRVFVPEDEIAAPDPGSETEMPEDDSIEVLQETIDLEQILTESLSLAIPAYPRAADVDLGDAVFSEPGVIPLTDEAARPFAGLASLRDKLAKDGGKS